VAVATPCHPECHDSERAIPRAARRRVAAAHPPGGSRWDAWASHLAEAPAPYTQSAITAAIRFYATKLDEIVADWDPHLQLDNRPLLGLLDAVEQQSTP